MPDRTHIQTAHSRSSLIAQVAIFGPPDTIYTGGYFKAQLTFPLEYVTHASQA